MLDRLLVSAVNSRSVRLLGVSASGFGSAVQQLDLFSTANVEQGRKDDAIDRVRDRFGGGALRLAGSLRPERDEESLEQTLSRGPSRAKLGGNLPLADN